jgi:hypothetical protein
VILGIVFILAYRARAKDKARFAFTDMIDSGALKIAVLARGTTRCLRAWHPGGAPTARR